MSLFDSSSKSTLTEIGATGEADVLFGKGSKLTESGAINIEKGATLNTGLDLSGAKTGNIVFEGGADDLLASNQSWFSALDRLTSSNAAALESVSGQQSSLVSDVLGKVFGSLSNLAESKQTDGESRTKQYLIWGFLAALGVLAFWLWKKRS